MTKHEALRYSNVVLACQINFGMDRHEVDTLLRAQKTLHTWAEHECNGAIQRDDATGKPSWYNTDTGKRLFATSDREAGALKRVKAICDAHGAIFYHQTDPRGCMLYILKPGDLADGSKLESCYSRGIAMCID